MRRRFKPGWQHAKNWLNRNRLTAVETLIAAAAAVTAALLALILDSLLSPEWRSLLLVAGTALITLLLLVFWRSLIRDRPGTLFCIQLLDEAMRDARKPSREAAIARSVSVRSLTRWVDLDHHTTDGIIDLSQPCQDLGTRLESLVNTDRDDTGCTVAPNLLWPVALSVGAYLPATRDIRVLEMNPTDPTKNCDFSLPLGEFDITTSHEEPTDEKLTRTDVHDNIPDSATVAVHLAFTKQADSLELTHLLERPTRRVYKIHPRGSILAAAAKTDSLDGVQLRKISVEISDEIEIILRDNPGCEYAIYAMIPKSVALTLGWHLSQKMIRVFDRLHLMHFSKTAPDYYLPMRVRPNQPLHKPFDDRG
ncbi:hypothetical protein SAMN06265360_1271 [Haloechinothrix alba]|uniref:Uncharacterized protein n=1 Tax=Haloechinothrix alba TaxID=664784 RepID=A0A238ZXU2_9PSEU|nr:hypothetical protein [Haloechinothrix alba]SNR87821.1 hypothetical protein SAMN06265360_1271 [Haloechinothrix alba]